MFPNYLPDVWSPKFKRLGCSKNKKKRELWSTSHDSAVLECNYKSIMRCWEQQERGMPRRTAHTLHATGYFTYLQPKRFNPPTTPLAPYCGNDQEQFVTLAQPICCFCFSNGGWSGADWWVGWCWAGWGMRKWREALTANYRSSVITGGQALATVHGQTVQHIGHL